LKNPNFSVLIINKYGLIKQLTVGISAQATLKATCANSIEVKTLLIEVSADRSVIYYLKVMDKAHN